MLFNLVSGLMQELAAGREGFLRAGHVKTEACDRESQVVGEQTAVHGCRVSPAAAF